MDMSKLTPSPWHSGHNDAPSPEFIVCESNNGSAAVAYVRKQSDSAFIALARNAFALMMKYECWVEPCLLGWRVKFPGHDYAVGDFDFPDPFTALEEAGKWIRDNIENKRS